MNEQDICELVIEMLSSEIDKSCFGIEERSSSYLSLICGITDVLRVKYTNNSKWISIRLAKEDKKEDDIRFIAQKNKGQLHWKAFIDDEQDLYKFKNELINACKRCESKYEPRKIIHSRIELEVDYK